MKRTRCSNSTSTATFYIDVDKSVDPKEHLSQVKVSYKYKPDEEENELVFEEKNLPLRLAVKPVPLYEITNVELIPEELTAGDDNVKLRLTIKNIGEEAGESVRLKAFACPVFLYETTRSAVSPGERILSSPSFTYTSEISRFAELAVRLKLPSHCSSLSDISEFKLNLY